MVVVDRNDVTKVVSVQELGCQIPHLRMIANSSEENDAAALNHSVDMCTRPPALAAHHPYHAQVSGSASPAMQGEKRPKKCE